jgi:hypothetical protein
VRGGRSDFVSRAFSLQRLVVKQCASGAGCHERFGIGAHRIGGVTILIQGAMPSQRDIHLFAAGTDPYELMTAAALLLDRWAGHRSVRAEYAAVARLGFKQCLTACALVKILARVRRHDFLPLLPAIRAGEHGFQDNGAHGVAIRFARWSTVIMNANSACLAKEFMLTRIRQPSQRS